MGRVLGQPRIDPRLHFSIFLIGLIRLRCQEKVPALVAKLHSSARPVAEFMQRCVVPCLRLTFGNLYPLDPDQNLV